MNKLTHYLLLKICFVGTILIAKAQIGPIQMKLQIPEVQQTLNTHYEWTSGEKESFNNLLSSGRFSCNGMLNMYDVDQLRTLKDLLDLLPSDRVLKNGEDIGVGTLWWQIDPCIFQNISNTKQKYDQVSINYKLPAYASLGATLDPVFEINTIFPCGGGASPILYVNENKQFGFGTNQPASTYHFATPDFQIGDDSKFKMKINGATNNEYFLLSKNGHDLFKVNNEGKVFAREFEITLTTSFPDYVFDQSYKLISLTDLDQYVKQNKHLPGIASAEEYECKGTVDMGNLQLKMLEKIEELTLYVIQQQQQIAEQQKEINTLKSTLNR